MISWLERKSWLCWSFTMIIAVMIFYISSLSFAKGPVGGSGSLYATIYHILAFFFFAFFLFISIVKGRHKSFLIIGFLVALIYGVTDEIHQLFVPGRYGSLHDVFLDGVGITFAMMIYLLRLELLKTRSRRK